MRKSITIVRNLLFPFRKGNVSNEAVLTALFMLLCLAMSNMAFAQTIETFSTVGTGTFNTPAGVSTVRVQAWGGGGAGGGVDGGSGNRGGGGGAGGTYTNNNTVSVSHGTAITVTVANGGQGSDANDGPNGGTSTFASTTPVTAVGGNGGKRAHSGALLGAGGATTTGVTYNGGAGAAGHTASGSGRSGAGGGGAGTNESGDPGNNTSAGSGGNASGGNGGAGRTNNGDGNNGSTIAGGGGGGRGTSNTDYRGGHGARGEVRVSYNCPSYQMTQSPTSNGPFCGASAAAITLYSSSMASGSYQITYSLSGATSGSNLTANVTFTAGSPGTATFNTGSLSVGTTNVTITRITSFGCNNTVSTNNTVSVVVNPILNASVSIAASETTICDGESVTFTATPTNGGSSPSYQWRVNGSPVGLDSATYSSSTLVNGDVVTCVMTSNASPCLQGSPATSANIAMTVNDLPTAMLISPAAALVCPNAVTALTVSGGIGPVLLFSDDFNGTPLFTASGSVSGGGHAWQKQNSPYNVTAVGNFNTTPDTGAMMITYIGALFNSTNANTQLTSPAINASEYSTLNLSYRHTYKKGNESGVTVQVSTNGGGAWTTVKTHTSNQGSAGAFVSDNINLNSYAGSASLMIRFNYTATQGAFNSAWWAVDNVVVSGNGRNIIWSPTAGLYSDAAATVSYTGDARTTVYAKLTSGQTYTATSTTIHGCVNSAETTLTIQALPTLTGVSQATVCENTSATIGLRGLPASGTFNIGYTINGGATQNATGVMSDGSGNASFTHAVTLANNGQTLAITSIQRTDNSPSCTFNPSSNNTVVLTVNANATYYADADGDGFGDSNTTEISCFGPSTGFVANNTDCNDTDDTVNATYPFYADGDLDGFGTGSLVSVCAVDAMTPPSGYSLSDTDCNDADSSVNAEFAFYVDGDGDGFGAGSSVNVCAVDESTPPSGYSLNDTDCNDADDTMNTTFSFYVDADLDGFGAGSLVAGVCAVDANTPPAGHSVVDGDCNDTLSSVYPGAAEVPYNGVDDDCDGTIDENSLVFSQVLPSQCATTLVNIGSLIGCVSVPAGTGYRFEVTDTNTNAVYVLERTVPNFALTSLPVYNYSTTYSIRVMVQRNYVWLNYYGDSCLVSSPAVTSPGGASQVNASQCGQTIATINTLIATTSLPNVAQYRFRITDLTDGDGPNQVQTIERPLHWFSLKMLTRYNYGTSYSVEVAIRATNSATFTGFGAPCVVHSPAVPQIVNCGATVSGPTVNIATTSLNSVTQYRFVVTDFNTFAVTTIDRPLHWFNFSMIPGYQPGGLYGVQVAVMTSGEWSPFSEGCEITAPGGARQDVKQQVVPFNAVAYPNPFASAFNIEVSTSAEADLKLKVYDMTGRMLEDKAVSVADMQTLQIGENFPAGVYNVIVSQGDQAKTMRVVKR